MVSVVMQPAADKSAQKHYSETIGQVVDFSEYRNLIEPSDYDKLIQMFPTGQTRFWGVTRGKQDVNVKKWERIEKGDIAIFSKQRVIFMVGTIVMKLKNSQLAERLWGSNGDNDVWELMYVLDEIRETEIPIEEFNSVVGYRQNYNIQGFGVLGEDKSTVLLNAFEFNSRQYYPESTIVVTDDVVSRDWDELDLKVSASRRREQGYLRDMLLDGKNFDRCAICGEGYPVEFLVAAHIKKRAIADAVERTDIPNIAMLACRFGCDDLFENGFISVNEKGIVVTARLDDELKDSALEKRLNHLNGKVAAIDFPPRAGYFAWHMRATYRGNHDITI